MNKTMVSFTSVCAYVDGVFVLLFRFSCVPVVFRLVLWVPVTKLAPDKRYSTSRNVCHDIMLTVHMCTKTKHLLFLQCV